MKFMFAVLLIAFCWVANFAQADDAEKDFVKNKAKYKLDKFAEGEDASSGYDYLFYTNKTEIVKVREIWSSLSYAVYRVEDYFKDGKLVAVLKYGFPKKHYKAAKKGNDIPLKLTEKMYLTDSKLTTWIENGKTIANSDTRWNETEKNALESANYKLESYQQFKEDQN
jgi:hypothetical protein